VRVRAEGADEGEERQGYAVVKARRLAEPVEPTLSDKLTAIREIGWRVPTRGELRERDRRLGEFFTTARGFLMKCARWFIGDDLPAEDVLQEARLAMWGAMLDWDETRAPFDTHCRWRIRTALGKMLRESRMVRGRVPEDFVGDDEAGEVRAEIESAEEVMLRGEVKARGKFRGRKRTVLRAEGGNVSNVAV
jgi:Sigma-70 region 2